MDTGLLEKVLFAMNIPVNILEEEEDDISNIDFSLRKNLIGSQGYTILRRMMNSLRENNTIYNLKDEFYLYYWFCHIPDEHILFIGPVLGENMSETQISDILRIQNIPKEGRGELQSYYLNLNVVDDIAQLETTLIALFEATFQTTMRLERIEENNTVTLSVNKDADLSEHNLQFQTFELRYRLENQVMDAVARGDLKEALHIRSRQHPLRYRHRYDGTSPLRIVQNRLIVFNTLCRKAAERGGFIRII